MINIACYSYRRQMNFFEFQLRIILLLSQMLVIWAQLTGLL
jgi:hypothetical protein